MVDLRDVDQLTDPEQVTLWGQIRKMSIPGLMDGHRSVSEIVDQIATELDQKGTEAICTGRFLPAGYAVPRKQEIAACINRYRQIRLC